MRVRRGLVGRIGGLRSPRSSPRATRKWIVAITVGGTSLAALFTVIWLVFATQTIAGTPRMIGRSHNDPNFPNVHAVSGMPSEWIATVCKPHAYANFWTALFPAKAQYLYPNTAFHLPRSVHSALCSAKYEEASDPVVLIAVYQSEDLMQLDLADNGIQWYCFAAVDGNLFVMATRAEERVMGANSLNASPVLAPLVDDGFIVYADPGR
ncbi:hypothetical protein MAGR_04740 [Mycolicibacterium agri]|uniref:Uncharacterized protein n=2 Tax=Mycolicibacterium agri TaxID=36811 RepID=A0A7I9VUE2_MYCAG|nr:hypothetical protein MAGR_04740 [Mycolicibacterium agri]